MMNKIKLGLLLVVLVADYQVAHAQQWPQDERAYSQTNQSSNWGNNRPVTMPSREISRQPAYGNGQGQYVPNQMIPRPYPSQQRFMAPSQYYGSNRGYYPRANNGWQRNNYANSYPRNYPSNGWGNNGFPNLPNSNFDMPNFNGNDMPFMGNNGNNPWSDMPSPSFNFPTMNFPSW